MSETTFKNSFLAELYTRTTNLSEKSTAGNVCIQISLQGSSINFIGDLEKYLFQNECILKLHIRGMDYLVELLNCDSPLDAYKKSKPVQPH